MVDDSWCDMTTNVDEARSLADSGRGNWSWLWMAAAIILGIQQRSQAMEEPSPWSGVAFAEVGYTASVGFRDATGGISSQEARGELRGYWQPRAGIRLGLGIGWDGHRYDGEELRSRFDLRRDAALVWVRLPAAVMFSQHWGISTISSLGSGTDARWSIADGRQYVIEGGLLYYRDRDLAMSLAMVVSTHLQGQASILPLVSLYWRFADDWRLTVVDEVDNTSRLTWRWKPDLDVGMRVDIRSFEFAVHPQGQGTGAVLRDEVAVIGAESDWRPREGSDAQVRLFAGIALFRRISVYDRGGNALFIAIARPAPAFGLSVKWAF